MLIEYLKDVKDIKDILKIRLHMWDVKKNYAIVQGTQTLTKIQYDQFAEKEKIQQSMCQIVKQNLRNKNKLLGIGQTKIINHWERYPEKIGIKDETQM